MHAKEIKANGWFLRLLLQLTHAVISTQTSVLHALLATALGDVSDGRGRQDTFVIYGPFETPGDRLPLQHQPFYEECG